ncbi:hypothetical protein C5E07_02895 [Pseudoclavibacter sp. RFBJ3]|nr:hypothetical protein C5C12_16345 [Pseudoclavibacter sp. RFBJ5]PPF94376.1 hypothetical protein C5E07_02895 [Pseudoclavibacter sp. RFBJ3]PPF99483.1 hypothetical protein C5C19_04530 [Pseudoclavibacter sp. RFBH5]PPG25677.1 hypothetical protein C5E13_01595 [Pseudoclavibacter sp. RFBI4]
MVPNSPTSLGPDSFDRIAFDLRELREASGAVSYAELVRRITDLRLGRGVHAAAAIPARSTVYNAFRAGRTRLDTELLRDIVTALGADEREADSWVRRCRDARRTAQDQALREQSREVTPAARPAPAAGEPMAPVGSSTPATWAVVLLLLVCVGINLLGLFTANVFRLSAYLDMVGTAVAALALGPWHGVIVAVASSSLGFVVGDPETLSFLPVNIVGALVWGYGVRRFGMGSGLVRFLALNLIAALACALVAAPVVATLFDAEGGHASKVSVLSLEAMSVPFMAAVFSANIVTSVMDKLLTGCVALGIFAVLRGRFGLSAEHLPLVTKL